MSALLDKSSIRSTQLEGPQKVVGFLEVWANSVDLMDEVFNADNSKFAKFLKK